MVEKRVFIGRIEANAEGDDGNNSNVNQVVSKALSWIQWEKIIKPGDKVFIKPNLTWPTHQPGVTTTPEMIEAVVSNLKNVTSNITVGESDGGYHSFQAEEGFKNHGLYEMEKRYGIEVINLCKTPSEVVRMEIDSKEVEIDLPSMLLHEIDLFITLPVPKVHAMTKVSLGFKNQWGCIPKTMRLRNHPEFNQKILAINRLFQPSIVIYDGTYFLDENGPQTGVPRRMNLIIASNDIGAGDYVCCKIMNVDPAGVKHLRVAKKVGMFPASEDEFILNDEIRHYNDRTFKLNRTLLNWIALVAFNSRFGTRLIYDSSLSDFIHKVLFAIRKNPSIRKILYGKFGVPE